MAQRSASGWTRESSGVTALFLGGYSFSAPPLSGHISRQQRSYAGRARDGIHDFPNGGWRPSTPHILERIEEKDGTLVWDGKQQSIRKIVNQPETAYEVHSCLVDALSIGTGRAAYTQFGLKKFPAAGKTGTAYDFTDALLPDTIQFHLRCLAGFDKPQENLSRRVRRELALRSGSTS